MKIFKRFVSVLMGILCMLTIVINVGAEEFDIEDNVPESEIIYSQETSCGNLELYENGELLINPCRYSTEVDHFMIRFNTADLALINIKIKNTDYSIQVNEGVELINIPYNSVYNTSISILFNLNINNLNNILTFEVGNYTWLDNGRPFTRPLDVISIPLESVNTFLSNIHELESQINDLNAELEQLRAEKEVWEHNETHLLEDIELLYKENEILVARRGDINDDGLFTVADAVLLMRYVAGTIDTIPYKKIN